MKIAVLALFFAAVLMPGPGRSDELPSVTLDENVWVLFYDLPSRRFRSIREAHLRRDWERASDDLRTSAGFLAAEAGRASAPLHAPLNDIADRLNRLAAADAASDIAGEQLDAAFGRAHWLLAQHYLVLARDARDTGAHRMAGTYLLATAHHMERAALWSDAKLTRRLAQTLDRLRDHANDLREGRDAARVYRDKPIVAAEKTLRELGVLLDRKVLLD